MKRILALVLSLMLILGQLTLAEGDLNFSSYSDDALSELYFNIQAELANRNLDILPNFETYSDETLSKLAEALTAEQDARGIGIIRTTLQKGSKGEEVKALQQRLIELNYLSGSADGDYGNKTKAAVELFQKEVDLNVTGIADHDTLERIYADDAPVATVYLTLDYNAISRDPDSYEGKNYQFSGKVVQVMEEKMENYTYTVMRISTKGNYDNICYVTYLRENSEKRILEDDRVNVYATCLGLYTYETVLGSSVTIPNFLADSISLQ